VSNDAVISVHDSSAFGALGDEQVAWLRRLQEQLLTDDHIVRIQGPAAEDPEPVVYSDAAGQWRAGRYVGSLSMDGVRLDIEPRFPFEVLLRWVDAAFEFIAIPQVAQLQRTESFVPWLLAMLWARRLDAACRHGLPSLRVEVPHEGPLARGRIDVRATTRLRRQRPGHLATQTRERTLDNDIVRTLVCAENTLRYVTGSDLWQSRRVRDLCARMRDSAGARPLLPPEADLARIRYTPIRQPFRELVAFSHRLAGRRGYLSSPESGTAEGVLLDVAELWELFLVGCVRHARPDLTVQHGTRALTTEPVHLLHSAGRPEVGLGRLLPDILVSDGEGAVAVLDAKYKRLGWAPDRPDGVDRGDRYQLVSYISRFRAGERTLGALLYPRGMGEDDPPAAECNSPWLTRDDNAIHFLRMPVDRHECTEAMRRLLDTVCPAGVAPLLPSR
jgi:5-methylcytosine-specific restriction enzyme subunit McrC